MRQTWQRPTARRVSALAVAAALAAGGITYAGFQAGSGNPATTHPARDGEGEPTERKVDEASAVSLARKAGKPVEVTALRTIRSTTWARPDGLMTKKLYSSPLWAKSGDEWKKIDTTLQRTGTGWAPAATNTKVVFSGGSPGNSDRASRGQVHRISLVKALKTQDEAGSPLVTLTVGGTTEIPETHEIQLTWPGPVPTPIIDGSRALYPEIFPGADLVLTAEDDGFAQLIVVKNRQAAADPRVAQLSYGLASPTLTFTLDSSSGIVTAQDPDGQDVALSPTPLMWDSSGAPAVTDGELGASSQPTAPESPETPAATTSAPEPSPSTSTEDLADDNIDPEGEVLPTATDEAAPTITDAPLPPVPAEPTPAPSQTGNAATLSLPLLNGPSPESRGDIVEAELGDGTWLLTPSQDFLTNPATVYPVFIDPTVKKHTQDWTTAYSRHPSATFFNGKDFNQGGTHEARVGFESDTWGTSRSYFNISYDKNLKGARIQKATLRMLETYSWSCSPRAMSVHVTSPINGRTNWKNAPPLTDSNLAAPARSFAHGYKTNCRDDYETFNVLGAAQKAADQGKSMITFGMRARDEKSQYAWKKFQADGDNAPYLELTYNRPPTAPTNLDLGPDFKCTTNPPYVRVGSSSLTFTARSTDQDSNLDYLDFALWPTNKWSTTGDMLKSTGTVSVGSSTAAATRTTPGYSTDALVNNTVYSWSVRAVDSAGSSSAYMPKVPCRFIWDETAPKPPRVSSTDFPNADGNENTFGNDPEDSNWSKIKFGSTGTFKFQALDSDVIRFEYGFNANNYPIDVTLTTNPTTVSGVKPPAAGPNVLYVRTVDQTGHVSEPTKYFFYVTPREEADLPGDVTGDTLPDLFTITGQNNLRLFPSQALSSTATTAKGTGKFDYSMSGAYQLNPNKDPNGGDGLPIFIAPPSAHFNGALITHNGDFYGGDGLEDLIVRVGGKLWMYPGDGYGAVNVTKRREILLPAGSPAASSLTQIKATGDITGDKLPDVLATSGDELWAFIGYTGASFTEARLITGGTWTDRDIVTVADFSGDNIPDLLFRGPVTDKGLVLRKGKPSGTGVDLASLATEASSLTGQDTIYGTGGWNTTQMRFVIGTPDVDRDTATTPDIWAMATDGTLYFYPGEPNKHGTRTTASWVNWTGTRAFG
ncbi:DNRLRE domain-containing protein [Streptomyces sp. MBT42]|uniref:DNRLRE domain-containing protein n=1 Tax=Streptomyces sp. MBT42 TaxID=1488373 RepID=UPI001E321539|nr:DNRLRE domain-containing protein [Streptomyces sp. MBT42]MCD2469576.1 DNRLRE domain-containing protein [Streptomyces sp. MBT42]